MLGTFRFALAILVISSHLGGFGAHGSMAVYGFFVVSGYLMTLVLNRTYRFNAKKFWLNRFLRLYPAYYFACALTLVALIFWPAQAAAYHAAFNVSLRPIDWFGILAMFPFPFYDAAFRPVPPTWSVGVEIVMYFALFVFVARRRSYAVISLSIALGYLVLAHWPGVHLDTVGSIPAALLPFSLGSLIFFAGDRIKLRRRATRWALAGVGVMWLLNLWAVAAGVDDNLTFYLNLFLSVVLVSLLGQLEIRRKIVRATDKFLGDLAYPLFLVHWTVGFFISVWRGEIHGHGPTLLLLSLLFSTVLSIGILFFIDWPLQRIRARVRPVEPAVSINPQPHAQM